jgi:putative heme transporter
VSERTAALRRHAPRLIGVVIVVVLFAFVLPRIADYRAVWNALSDLSWQAGLAVLAAAALNVLTFGPPYMAALPGLSYGRSMTVSLSATAASNVFPGGDAVGIALAYGMLRGWAFAPADVTLALVVFSVWNQLVNVAFPVIAIVLLALEGERNVLLQFAAAIGGAILAVVLVAFALMLRSESTARAIGRLAERVMAWFTRVFHRRPREDVVGAVVRFRTSSLALIRRRWHLLTLATLAGHLTVWLVLLVSLRAVGVTSSEVSAVESFAAWSLVRLLTAIPITPGGLGVVELGLTGTLVGFGGHETDVVAAVLLYRAMTFLPPILLGLAASLTFRRAHPDFAAQEMP